MFWSNFSKELNSAIAVLNFPFVSKMSLLVDANQGRQSIEAEINRVNFQCLCLIIMQALHACAFGHKDDWVSEKVRYMSKVLHRGSQFYNRNNCWEVIDILTTKDWNTIEPESPFFLSNILLTRPCQVCKDVFL